MDLFDVGPREAKRNERVPLTAGPIGSGPAGETCGSCKHLYPNRMAKVYWKCGLMRKFWTGGAGTDIRRAWAACEKWEADVEDQESLTPAPKPA